MKFKIRIGEEDYNKAQKKNAANENSEENNEEKFRAELDELKDKYDKVSSVSVDSRYDYKARDERTDEDLEALASAMVGSYDDKKQKNIDKYDKKNAENLEKIEEIEEKTAKKQDRVENEYNKSVTEAKEKSIKNGIGRSSIIENIIDEYHIIKQAENQKNANTMREKISVIEKQIESDQEKLKEALDKLDMERAIIINDKLEKLKNERDTLNKKVDAFNAQIDYKKEHYRDELNNSKEWVAQQQEAEKYLKEIVYKLMDRFSAMKKEDALKELDSGKYDKYLWQNQKKILYSYINAELN